MNVQYFLLQKIRQALIASKIEFLAHLVTVQPSAHTKFGDYQVNGLITVAQQLNIFVADLAQKIIYFLYLNDVAKEIKIETPGFINIFLKSEWIADKIDYIFSSPNLGITPVLSKNIIIDYSGPNIAKEMHVGHLRSTVIGDSIARILSFLGHNVIRINHIGDWGTPFGMLIAYIEKNVEPTTLLLDQTKNIKFSVLEKYYQEAKKNYDSDPIFAELSRNYVLKLQQGNHHCRQIWKRLVDISILNNQKIYIKLNISLKKSDIMGESAYNEMLPSIVKDLKNKKLAVISDGAVVVFLNNTHTKNNIPFGVIIQKKDGAYLYSTTDIAAIKYRCETLLADRIIYYTDNRQKQHLIQVWDIANKAGYIKKSISLEHHVCGMLLSNNGKPFQTRSGAALKISKLLSEGLKRARYIIRNKHPHLSPNKTQKLAHIISVGAIKYSELSKNRTTNYVFNWDNMLRFEGNTAPYIQYAYTRICSILKHIPLSNSHLKKIKIQLITTEEISLSICLLQFEERIVTVSNQGTPHILCAYLYKLSVLFSVFYEHCSILHNNNIHTKNNRLKLAVLTARTLKKGLNLLGIKTTQYM